MKYICEFYIPVPNDEGRYYALSACDKATYVHSVLNRLGYDIEIISPSYAKKTSKTRTDCINEHVRVTSGFSLGWHGNITKTLSRISAMLWLLKFFIVDCKRYEKIMIYHGVQNAPIFIIAKFFKKFHYILEVEEIYSELMQNTGFNWRGLLEKKMFQISDSFVFASSQLENVCNYSSKPYSIVTGSYIPAPKLSEQYSDGKMHIVYAGLIEKDKVAFKSVRIGKYLTSNYQIHIIGYGNDEDIKALNDLIDIINQQAKCVVKYDGLKRGIEYSKYLQQCHIGICPLSKSASYQNACFPSKITSYLCNGLLVATTENAVLKSSVYKNSLLFVKDDDPQSFAIAIMSINYEKYDDPRCTIDGEDKRTLCEFKNIFRYNE